MEKTQSENLNLINKLKDELSKISITRVAEVYGTARSTIYFLLNEERADIVNLEALSKLAAAIKKVKQEQNKKRPIAKQILKTLND